MANWDPINKEGTMASRAEEIGIIALQSTPT